MANVGPRYSKEEFARRGDAIYERDIRPRLSAEDDGKFVAIDIETGDYEIDPDDFEATERLSVRRPEAQMWLVRVGHRAAHSLGGRPLRHDA
jgi:hypothetical protein